MDGNARPPVNRSAVHELRVGVHHAFSLSQSMKSGFHFLADPTELDNDHSFTRDVQRAHAWVTFDGFRNLTPRGKGQDSQSLGFQRQVKHLRFGEQPLDQTPFLNPLGTDQPVLNRFVYSRERKPGRSRNLRWRINLAPSCSRHSHYSTLIRDDFARLRMRRYPPTPSTPIPKAAPRRKSGPAPARLPLRLRAPPATGPLLPSPAISV